MTPERLKLERLGREDPIVHHMLELRRVGAFSSDEQCYAVMAAALSELNSNLVKRLVDAERRAFPTTFLLSPTVSTPPKTA